jgi:hypothetical protein
VFVDGRTEVAVDRGVEQKALRSTDGLAAEPAFGSTHRSYSTPPTSSRTACSIDITRQWWNCVQTSKIRTAPPVLVPEGRFTRPAVHP